MPVKRQSNTPKISQNNIFNSIKHDSRWNYYEKNIPIASMWIVHDCVLGEQQGLGRHFWLDQGPPDLSLDVHVTTPQMSISPFRWANKRLTNVRDGGNNTIILF